MCREKILISFRVPRAKKFENHWHKDYWFWFYFSKNFVVWKQTNFHIKKISRWVNDGSTRSQHLRNWQISGDTTYARQSFSMEFFFTRNAVPWNFSKYIVSHFIQFSTPSNWIFALWGTIYLCMYQVFRESESTFWKYLGKENHASLYWKMLLCLHRNSSNRIFF